MTTQSAKDWRVRRRLFFSEVIGTESGAHINPAVTMSFWLMRKLDTRAAVGYIVAQVTGACLGALPLLAWGSMDRSFAFGVMGEAVTTFALVATLSVFLGFRHLRHYTPLVIPCLCAVMVPLEAHVSGTSSTNPARTFGPALISGRFGTDGGSTGWAR